MQRISSRLKQKNYKAYILWTIGINTGYRGCDLIKLTVRDIRDAIKSGELIILEQKTRNTRKIQSVRVVILSNKLLPLLSDFIIGKEDAEYLYPSCNKLNINITRDRLGKIFKSVIKELGISDGAVGVHTPRKTYGYLQYIEHDKDIYYVQRLFGHSRPDITMNYIGLDEDILKESAITMNKYIY